MFKKEIIFKYESALEEYPDSIVPSKKYIPEWYKKIPKWKNKNNELFNFDTGVAASVKQCIPFLDSFTTGYTITLPYDIYIKNNEGSPYLVWPESLKNHPNWRKDVADLSLVPAGHHPIEYVWDFCVSYMIPKGYSLLLTHPLNRHDLPFTTLSGIIDGGWEIWAHGNIPFYIKENFEGLIEKGTPVAQIIPFRQEKWKLQKTFGLVKKADIHNKSVQNVFFGWYKKTFWNKKEYN